MMGLLKQPIERKLSAVLGTAVTFEALNFSVFGGSAEARGVVVAGNDPAVPLLTIDRVRAEVSLSAALKKEFVVKSLTIEKPVVAIVRDAAGKLNLPQPPASRPVADMPKSTRQTSDGASAAVSDSSASVSSTEESGGSWKFEARKVLLLNGEIHYRDATGYHASLDRILAEIKEASSGFDITFLAESAGRRDVPAELGNVRFNGHAANLANISQWKKATIEGAAEVADILHLQMTAPSLHPLSAKVEINAAFDLDRIPPLLPNDLPLQQLFATSKLQGRVQITGNAQYAAGKGLSVPDLIVRALELSIALPMGATTSD